MGCALPHLCDKLKRIAFCSLDWMGTPILAVLYASQTGVSKSLAEKIWALASTHDISAELYSFEQLNVEKLPNFQCVIFVCSSTGQGDPPDSASKFYRRLRVLHSQNSALFCNMRFSILGLGDSNYQTFGAFPRALNKVLHNLGCALFYNFALADDAVGLDAVVEPWIDAVIPAVKQEFGVEMSAAFEETLPLPGGTEQSKSILLSNGYNIPEKGLKMPNLPVSTFQVSFGESCNPVDLRDFEKKYYQSLRHVGSTSPIEYLPIKSIVSLTTSSALKQVYELCLDAQNLSSFSLLNPGDSFSIVCRNDETEVTKLLERLDSLPVADKPISLTSRIPSHLHISDANFTLRTCLSYCLDLRSAPKKSFLRLMSTCCSNSTEKEELEYLSSFDGTSDFSLLVREEQLSILDLLYLFPSVKIDPLKLIENLSPLKPRSYSLSNNPIGTKEVRFAFSVVHLPNVDSKRQYDRYGVCTKFLMDRINEFECGNRDVTLPVYTKSNQAFSLPEDLTTPLVFVSAGTGIAPYIGFFEYFEMLKSTGKTIPQQIWLLHGCRNRLNDFIYSEKIERWASDGLVTKLVLACSRQEPLQPDGSRTYVQNKLLEHGKELMDISPPATIYVCGDAARMAPLLREALTSIIEINQGVSKQESATILKQWTKNGRYKEDVWR